MNKKAMSPLIATLILIVVSVGLGAVVMSWGENYIETQAKFVQSSGSSEVSSCNGVAFNIVKTSKGFKVCSGVDYIEAVVENPSGNPIDSFVFNVVGSDAFSGSVMTPLSRGGVEKLRLQTTVKSIELIKITPVVKGTNCAQKTLTIENVPPCGQE